MSTPSASSLPETSDKNRDKATLTDWLHLELQKTVRHIQLLEATASFAWWWCTLLCVLAIAVVCDHWLWVLPSVARYLFWIAGISLSIFWLARRILPLFIYRIHPLYAAKVVEQALPELKNRLISWWELKHEPQSAPRGVVAAVGRQAVAELRTHDVSALMDTRPMIIAISIALSFTVSITLYSLIAPRSAWTTAERILFPWREIAPPARVKIGQVQPGSAVIPQSLPCPIIVNVTGLRSDENVFVRFTSADQQILDQRLQLTPQVAGSSYEGALTTDGRGIQQDVQYWIEAGDAVAGPYSLKVNPLPQLAIEKIKLTYPAYTQLPPTEQNADGAIEAVEGTEVELVANLTGEAQKSFVEFYSVTPDNKPQRSLRIEPIAVQQQSATAKFLLRLNAQRETPTLETYTLRAVDGSGHSEPNPLFFPIRVSGDYAPEIKLSASAPPPLQSSPRGSLAIEIDALDPDFGLSAVDLEIRRGDFLLETLSLHADEKGTRDPWTKRFQIRLAKWRLQSGDKITLTAIARDNRQQPGTQKAEPNVSRSSSLEVEIVEPPAEEKNKPTNGDAQAAEPPIEEINNEQEKNGNNSSSSKSSSAANNSSSADKSQSGNSGGGSSSDQGSQNQQNSQGNSGGDSESAADQKNQPSSGDTSGNNTEGSNAENQAEPTKNPNESSSGSSTQENSDSGSGSQKPSSDSNQTPPGKQNGEAKPSEESGDNNSSENATNNGGANSQKSGRNPTAGNQNNANPSPPPEHDGDVMERLQERVERERGQGKSPQDSSAANPNNSVSMNSEESSDNSENTSAGKQSDNNTSEKNNSEKNNSKDPAASEKENSQTADETSPPAGAEKSKPSGTEGGDENQANQKPNDKSADATKGTDNKSSTGDNSADKDSSAGAEEKTGGETKPQKPNEGKAQNKKPGSEGSEAPSGNDSKNDNSNGENAFGDDKAPKSDSQQSSSDKNDKQSKDGMNGQPQGSGDSSSSENGNQGSDAPSPDGENGKPGQDQNDSQKPSDNSKSGDTSQEGQPEKPNDQTDSSKEGNPGQEGKSNEEGKTGEAGDSKSTAKSGENSKSGESQTGKTGDANSKDSQGTGSTPAKSTDQNGSQLGDNAGNQPNNSADPGKMEGDRKGSVPGDNSQGTNPTEGAESANLDYAKEATNLALDYLERQKDQPDPELLKEMNWTKDDLNQFLERWKKTRDALNKNGEQRELAEQDLRSLGLRPPKSKAGSVQGNDDQYRDLRDSGPRVNPPKTLKSQFESVKKALQQRQATKPESP